MSKKKETVKEKKKVVDTAPKKAEEKELVVEVSPSKTKVKLTNLDNKYLVVELASGDDTILYQGDSFIFETENPVAMEYFLKSKYKQYNINVESEV
jgi:hypothetical protein